VNVLRGLAYQLARQNENAFVVLKEYYSELHPEKGLPRTLSADDLECIIVRMAGSFHQTYLVINGLDECGDNTKETLRTLCSIAGNLENISMSILSREEENIWDRLLELDEGFFNVKIVAYTKDITEYVILEIEKRIRSKKLYFEDPSIKTEGLEGL
ncbi:hypothetical protein LY78DRAFT_543206, partial [Colletotrichum sublineola]